MWTEPPAKAVEADVPELEVALVAAAPGRETVPLGLSVAVPGAAPCARTVLEVSIVEILDLRCPCVLPAGVPHAAVLPAGIGAAAPAVPPCAAVRGFRGTAVDFPVPGILHARAFRGSPDPPGAG